MPDNIRATSIATVCHGYCRKMINTRRIVFKN
jgi:hypothetical protein